MNLKRYIPDQKALRKSRLFGLFERFTHDQDLWHMNRHSVSEAIFWGSVCCFLPMPFQMIPCLLLCILRRCNIPSAIAVPMLHLAAASGSASPSTAVPRDVNSTSLDKNYWLDLANQLRKHKEYSHFRKSEAFSLGNVQGDLFAWFSGGRQSHTSSQWR